MWPFPCGWQSNDIPSSITSHCEGRVVFPCVATLWMISLLLHFVAQYSSVKKLPKIDMAQKGLTTIVDIEEPASA